MFEGKVVIITGAAGGIGTAIAHQFAQRDAVLVLTDIHMDGLTALRKNLEEYGVDMHLYKHDVSSPESWDKLIKSVLRKHDKIDILINNAGVVQPGAADKISIRKINQQVSVNFLGMIYGCRAVLPIMRKQNQGHIVNVASLGGIVPMPGEAVYCATKYAIRGYSLSLYSELKDTPIGISVICPDSVETPQLDYEMQFDESSLSFLSVPLEPEVVARAIPKAIKKRRSEVLVPAFTGVLIRMGMGIPQIFFLLFPRLQKMGTKNRVNRQKKRIHYDKDSMKTRKAFQSINE